MPFTEFILTVCGVASVEGRAPADVDFGTHLDPYLTGSIFRLQSGRKVLLAAPPTLANLLLYGANSKRPMHDYAGAVAVLVQPGDFFGFSGLTIHELINLSDASCMVARTCATPATTLPIVDEILSRLDSASCSSTERAALIKVVQSQVKEGGGATAKEAAADLRKLMGESYPSVYGPNTSSS